MPPFRARQHFYLGANHITPLNTLSSCFQFQLREEDHRFVSTSADDGGAPREQPFFPFGVETADASAASLCLIGKRRAENAVVMRTFAENDTFSTFDCRFVRSLSFVADPHSAHARSKLLFS